MGLTNWAGAVESVRAFPVIFSLENFRFISNNSITTSGVLCIRYTSGTRDSAQEMCRVNVVRFVLILLARCMRHMGDDARYNSACCDVHLNTN